MPAKQKKTARKRKRRGSKGEVEEGGTEEVVRGREDSEERGREEIEKCREECRERGREH